MARRVHLAGSVVALVGALAIVAPTAAQASTIYPPSDSCTASPATAAPGARIEFSCSPETFSSNERVTITVTGENGTDARIGMVRLAISTASGFAQSQTDGSLRPVGITLPSNASGTYNIAAVSASSAGGTAAVSASAGSDSALPSTGLDSGSLLGLWVGGGALVAAGAALGVTALVRRRLQHAE